MKRKREGGGEEEIVEEEKGVFQTGKIKKIVQEDEAVGRMAGEAPAVFAKCVELFIEELTSRAADIADAKKAQSISPQHIAEALQTFDEYDFLREEEKSK